MNNHNQDFTTPNHDLPRPDVVDRDETRSPQVQQPSDFASGQAASGHSSVEIPQYDEHSPPNEGTRQDAAHRVDARSNATEREQSRPGASGREQVDDQILDPTPDREPIKDPAQLAEPSANWIDVEQASVLLREKGVSRTIRTIQKMCKRGDLEARLAPTENGVRYIINEQSIDDFVARHNRKLPSGSLEAGESTQDTGLDPNPATDAKFNGLDGTQSNADSATNADGRYLREIIDLKDQQISMLQSQLGTANNQIAVKDEQFAAMIERDHETNILIQNLQRMVGLPEAKPSPEHPNHPVDVEHRQTTAFDQSG